MSGSTSTAFVSSNASASASRPQRDPTIAISSTTILVVSISLLP